MFQMQRNIWPVAACCDGSVGREFLKAQDRHRAVSSRRILMRCRCSTRLEQVAYAFPKTSPSLGTTIRRSLPYLSLG